MSNRNDTLLEEIEGLGTDEDAGWGDYPIDTLLIRTGISRLHSRSHLIAS